MIRTFVFLGLASLLVGCGSKIAKDSGPTAPSVPAGWAVADLKGVPFTLALPAELEPEVLSAADLQKSQPSSTGRIAENGLLAKSKTGELDRAVVGFELVADREITIDDSTKDFEAGLESSGVKVENFEETTVRLPVGSAKQLTATVEIGGRKGQMAYFVYVEGRSIYHIGIMDFPAQKDTGLLAQAIADSFRPRKS
ncbi:MAG: hypothetical protein K1X67_15485 [Fimbriimonadaceae bacterium]|nr:hypothetical protein [Fimbriimonadaceae bacterium]